MNGAQGFHIDRCFWRWLGAMGKAPHRDRAERTISPAPREHTADRNERRPHEVLFCEKKFPGADMGAGCVIRWLILSALLVSASLPINYVQAQVYTGACPPGYRCSGGQPTAQPAVGCLPGTVCPPSQIQPAPTTSNPTLTISPSSGPAGTSIQVSSSGWAAGSAVVYQWDGASGGNLTADARGNISTTLVVPGSLSPGTHSLDMFVNVPGEAALGPSASFTVTPSQPSQCQTVITAFACPNAPNPTIPAPTACLLCTLSVVPTSGPPGSSVAVVGVAWDPGSVTILWDGSPVGSANVSLSGSSSRGTFTTFFNVPSTATPGAHTVSAANQQATFTVTGASGGPSTPPSNQTPANPGKLQVTTSLMLSSSSIEIGQSITATFAVTNVGGQDLQIADLGAGGRRGVDWSGDQANFTGTGPRTLGPGEVIRYTGSQRPTIAGSYFAEPVVEDTSGNWGTIDGANRVYFTVSATAANQPSGSYSEHLLIEGDTAAPYAVAVSNRHIDPQTGDVSFKLALLPETTIPYLIRSDSTGASGDYLENAGVVPWLPNYPPISIDGITLPVGKSMTIELSKSGWSAEENAEAVVVDLAYIALQLDGAQPPTSDDPKALFDTMVDAGHNIPVVSEVATMDDFINAISAGNKEDAISAGSDLLGVSDEIHHAMYTYLKAAGALGEGLEEDAFDELFSVPDLLVNSFTVGETIGALTVEPDYAKVTITNASTRT